MIMMLACSLMWSSGGFLIKLIPWHPLVIASLRSIIAGSVLLVFMKYSKTKIEFDRYSITAGLIFGLSTACYVVANKMTTAANAIVIQSANPIFIIIITSLIYKQKARKIDLTVVFLCIVGICLFFFDEVSMGGTIGNLLALLSALCVALAYISTSKAPSQGSAMTGILLGHGVTCLIGMPFLFTNTPDYQINHILLMAVLGIFQLGIPYILFSLAIRRCPPLTCSLVGMIEPVASPIWVALAIGEIPGPLALFGGFIVIASIVAWSVSNSKLHLSCPYFSDSFLIDYTENAM